MTGTENIDENKNDQKEKDKRKWRQKTDAAEYRKSRQKEQTRL